jgi:hypothetical protein
LGIVEAQGVTLQLTKIGQGTVTGFGGAGPGGVLAPVPPWALGAVQAGQNGSPPVKNAEWVEVQNAAGQWVVPTPASIDAAVDSGGASPLYGLTNASTASAYPLTWVDDLYAPAHGLSMDKTNALAGLIRYLVTDGQKYTAANNDGQLSPALVVQGLNAANALVTSNCTEPGEIVVTDASPGPDAPDTPGLSTIGLMRHCEAAPPQSTPTTSTTVPPAPVTTPPSTTTTTAAASTTAPPTPATTHPATTTFHAPSPPAFKPSPPVTTGAVTTTTTMTTQPSAAPTAVAVPPTVQKATPPAAATPPTTAKAIDVAETAADLPIPTSGAGGGFDHLAALVVGAGLFLALGRPVRSLLKTLKP